MIEALSERSVCGSGKEAEAVQVVFGPAGGLQNAAKGLARERIATGMVVNGGQPAVGVAIDPAAGAGLAFQRKTVSSQGRDQLPYGGCCGAGGPVGPDRRS
jgi:hypothetical protein